MRVVGDEDWGSGGGGRMKGLGYYGVDPGILRVKESICLGGQWAKSTVLRTF